MTMARKRTMTPSTPETASSDTTAPASSSSPEALRSKALQEQADCRSAMEQRKEVQGWKESRKRIHDLRERMRSSFVDRDDAITAILAALISRTGCVLLGPPGTAKSLLVSRVARECSLRIGTEDANYFEYLLTAHTMPEEIFGPTEIGLLLQNPPQVQRRTVARLPHAELAFLDEVFRGGSHILNTLLTILNERRFYNGQIVEEVPLVGFIGAANNPPQTEELKAFFDRFPVRVWVNSVLRDESNRNRNARQLIAADAGIDGRRPRAEQPPSMLDFRKLWSILRVKLSPNPNEPAHSGSARLQEFTRNFMSFQADGQLSDRSFVQLWYFAGALDLVEGRDPDKSFAEGGRGHWNCFGYIAPTQQSEAVIKHNLKSRMAAYNSAGA
jgi:MoxR-like ATPase